MGGVSSKEEILARLDELDKKELALNIQLRDLQKQLNEIVPDDEKVKVNENLGREGEYDEIPEVGQRQNNKKNTKKNKNQKKKRRRDESDDEEESEEDEDDDDDDDEEKCVLQVQLFKLAENSHLLRFIKKSGQLDDFYKNMQIISDLAKEIL